MAIVNSFGTRTTLTVGGQGYEIYSLPTLQKAGFAPCGHILKGSVAPGEREPTA